MIVRNDREQWIGCDICEEVTELSRKVLANPETLVLLEEQLRKDHKQCENFKGNPELARLNRQFDRRVKEEMERAAGRGRDRRRAA